MNRIPNNRIPNINPIFASDVEQIQFSEPKQVGSQVTNQITIKFKTQTIAKQFFQNKSIPPLWQGLFTNKKHNHLKSTVTFSVTTPGHFQDHYNKLRYQIRSVFQNALIEEAKA